MRLLTVSEVARAHERSESTIRRLDDVLKPERTASGMRIYDADLVEKYFAARANRGRKAA